MMTDRQQVAMAFPCSRAAETVNRRYFDKQDKWSTMLTINK